MIEPNVFGIGLEADCHELNTAEALGFSISSSILENPFIIPDDENSLFVKVRSIAVA